MPSTALFWGLQSSFLSPALALILVTLFDASTPEVGWALSIYNASGFLASLVVPAYADRRRDYLRPMCACALLTVVLALVLAFATTLPAAVIALAVIGGPAGSGGSLLFAHLRHAGATPSEIVTTRAIVSAAWVAGPPLATLIIGLFGNRAILFAIGGVAVLSGASTAALITRSSASVNSDKTTADDDHIALPKRSVALIMVAFALLQAANSSVVSIMALFVTRTLHVSVIWAGVTLGIAAALEVPALLITSRLSPRLSSLRLIASGCVAGIAYYGAAAFVGGPLPLVGLQVLNAWSYATIAGVGLVLFQQMIPRPGLASGLYANTYRVGAILAGPVIALGSLSALGIRGVFLADGVLTVIALAVIVLAARTKRVRPVAAEATT